MGTDLSGTILFILVTSAVIFMITQLCNINTQFAIAITVELGQGVALCHFWKTSFFIGTILAVLRTITLQVCGDAERVIKAGKLGIPTVRHSSTIPLVTAIQTIFIIITLPACMDTLAIGTHELLVSTVVLRGVDMAILLICGIMAIRSAITFPSHRDTLLITRKLVRLTSCWSWNRIGKTERVINKEVP